MQLRIIAVGKLKQPGLEELADNYIKRSRSLIPIELNHVRNLKALRKKSDAPMRVLLDERGKQVTSKELAAWLEQWQQQRHSHIDFLIGDAHGFEDCDYEKADKTLALSKLTLPHRMAQLLLVEQLYRASTILAGHPYHHE